MIKTGVPQGSILDPVLYLLPINDVPTTLYSTTATYADHIAIMTVGDSTGKMANQIQRIQIETYQLDK